MTITTYATICLFFRPSNARAFINLLFQGNVEDAEDHIQLILDQHMRRINGMDYDVMLVDYFIVDVRSHTQPITTIGPPIEGKLNFKTTKNNHVLLCYYMSVALISSVLYLT